MHDIIEINSSDEEEASTPTPSRVSQNHSAGPQPTRLEHTPHPPRKRHSREQRGTSKRHQTPVEDVIEIFSSGEETLDISTSATGTYNDPITF